MWLELCGVPQGLVQVWQPRGPGQTQSISAESTACALPAAARPPLTYSRGRGRGEPVHSYSL